jgi:hypothetical protein
MPAAPRTDSPSGDADPPPALPFKPSIASRPLARPAAPAERPRNTNRRTPVEDPPPAFPLALAQ